jgi:Flp pilus assembly protein TadB
MWHGNDTRRRPVSGLYRASLWLYRQWWFWALTALFLAAAVLDAWTVGERDVVPVAFVVVCTTIASLLWRHGRRRR